jgi:hypothetical protein
VLIAPEYALPLAASERFGLASGKTSLTRKTRVGVFCDEGPGQDRGEWRAAAETAPGCVIRSYETASGRLDFCNGDPVNFFDPTGRVLGTGLSTGELASAIGSGLWEGAKNVGYSAVTAPYRMGQTVVSGYTQMGGLLGDVLTGNSGIVDMASHPINTLQATGNVALDTAVGIGKGIYWQAQTSEGLANLSTDLAMGLGLGAILTNTSPALRLEYESKVSQLADTANELKAAGMDPESIARALGAERRALGEAYKGMTPPDLLEEITQRNIAKYGDPLGPTVDDLVASGKTWEQIIDSASRAGGQDLNFGDTLGRNLTGGLGTAAAAANSAQNGQKKCP